MYKTVTITPENLTIKDLPAQDNTERLFLRNFLKPGMIFWDVGACAGLYSLVAAYYRCRVYSFEPNPSTYSTLIDNIDANSFNEQISPYRLAVSNKAGKVIFNQGKENNNASLGKPWKDNGKTFEAWALDIDTLLKEFGLPIPYIIKVDGNGAEPLILEGGQLLWNRKDAPIVICKFDKHHEGLPESNECFSKLPEFYTWHRINKTGYLDPNVNTQHVSGHGNMVAIPDGKEMEWLFQG